MASGIANHSLIYTVLRGGIAIHNPIVGNFGTAGFIATSNGADRWLVSCYHVLCRLAGEMPAGVEEPIFFPLDFNRQSPIAIASTQRANKELDCSAALILSGTLAIGEVLGLGKLGPPMTAVLGMRVLKSGAETGITEGRITGITQTEIQIAPLGLPAGYELSEGGDSGSVWVDAATHSLVGLHHKGSDWGTPERAFARPMALVLQSLGLQAVLG